MLIKKAPDIPSSEITPKWLYLNRRKFLAGALGVTAGALAGRTLKELAWPSQKVLAGTKLNVAAKSPFSTTEASDPLRRRDALQQLLRVWHGKGRSRQECDTLSHFALERESERAGGQASHLHPGGVAAIGAARGAHLPSPLRGGLVDCRAVGRLLLQRAAEGGVAPAQGKIRGV